MSDTNNNTSLFVGVLVSIIFIVCFLGLYNFVTLYEHNNMVPFKDVFLYTELELWNDLLVVYNTNFFFILIILIKTMVVFLILMIPLSVLKFIADIIVCFQKK